MNNQENYPVECLKDQYMLKVFRANGGAVMVVSCILSLLLMTSCSNILGTHISVTVNDIIGGVDMKRLTVPVLIEVIGITFYGLFLAFDLFTGIRASKVVYHRENPNAKGMDFFCVNRLYKTLWKMLSIMVLTSLFMVISMITILLGQTWPYNISVYLHFVTLIAATLFEFSSVGNNLQKSTGSKPDIFKFVDRIFLLFRKKAEKKIDEVMDSDI